MIVLSDAAVRQLLTMEDSIKLVERAFVADARGDAVTFPAIVQNIGDARSHFGLKSGYLRLNGEGKHSNGNHQSNGDSDNGDSSGEVIGLKAGGYWMSNREKYGLPNHRATLLLINPENGEALALMSANTITRMRTAAAGAVAARHLSVESASVVAVIGAGEQAHAQLEALRLVRRVSLAYVWARRPEAARSYAAEWAGRGLEVRPVVEIRDALKNAQIVIAATAATEPLIFSEWIGAGVHINAVGSDGVGKCELDLDLLTRSKVVADKTRQSLTIGELQRAVRKGLDAESMLYAELGQICAGMKRGRETENEVTIFDSSGVSFQDLVVASFLAHKARHQGIGTTITI